MNEETILNQRERNVVFRKCLLQELFLLDFFGCNFFGCKDGGNAHAATKFRNEFVGLSLQDEQW